MTLTYISMVTLTVEILQDNLVLHLPLKSVMVFTFNSFLYYSPVIQEFFFYIDFQCIHRLDQSSNEGQFNGGEDSIKFSIKTVIHSFNHFQRFQSNWHLRRHQVLHRSRGRRCWWRQLFVPIMRTWRTFRLQRNFATGVNKGKQLRVPQSAFDKVDLQLRMMLLGVHTMR